MNEAVEDGSSQFNSLQLLLIFQLFRLNFNPYVVDRRTSINQCLTASRLLN